MSLFNYKRFTGDAAEGGGPYVVDTHATRPPLPPRLRPRPSRGKVAQTLLFMLVSLALCCVVVEACFIYHLHQAHQHHPDQADSSGYSKLIAVGNRTKPKPHRPFHPSKPVAHLTDGQDVNHSHQIMDWSTVAKHLLYQMSYKDRSLIIQKDGYYYVYCKVSFRESGMFHHSIEKRTKKYPGKNIPLLQSREYSPNSSGALSNSVLGGVFQLEKNDALLVNVSSTAKVARHGPMENVFGAYMI